MRTYPTHPTCCASGKTLFTIQSGCFRDAGTNVMSMKGGFVAFFVDAILRPRTDGGHALIPIRMSLVLCWDGDKT